jgi:hypothetical protein
VIIGDLDVVDIMDNHKLIVPLKVGETKIIDYVKNEELHDIMHEAHIKTGRGGRNYTYCQTRQHSLNNYCACQQILVYVHIVRYLKVHR